jgi:ATP-dependent Lhr-like helicase
VGEQFALPDALAQLRAVASQPLTGVAVRLSAADPLNLTGILLPGERVPAVRGREIVFIDGIPETAAEQRTLVGATAGSDA